MTTYTPIQSIATSHAQNDSGLFELAFRDERYLPFEGAGAVSQWRLELPTDFRQFDYDTISDVVMHLRYTARNGGEELAKPAVGELKTKLNELMELSRGRSGFFRMFSARHEFSTSWHKFLNPPAGQDHELTLEISKERFPFFTAGRTIRTRQVEVFARIDDSSAHNLVLTPPNGSGQSIPLKPDQFIGTLHHCGPTDFDVTIEMRNEAEIARVVWKVEVANADVRARIKDLILIFNYSL